MKKVKDIKEKGRISDIDEINQYYDKYDRLVTNSKYLEDLSQDVLVQNYRDEIK